MALYDIYEEYRDPNLSKEEQLDVADAQKLDAQMRNDPKLNHEPGGVRNRRDGVFVPYPLVQTHIGIAMNRARAQFSRFDQQKLVMPEDMDASIRFPGIDPVGKYSVIDMKFAQREADIRAALESRSPEVQAYVNDMLNKCGDRRSVFYDVKQQMLQASFHHRQITRASKLCLDADGRRLLHQQSRVLETELPVEQYDMLMQGLEYAAGVRQGPVPKEITGFYKDRLNTELDLGMVNAARNLNQVPPKINVEFQDLDHKMLQQTFASPDNWGKSPDEVIKAADSIDDGAYSSAIPAYAVATANRVIDPLFRDMEKDAPANARGLDIQFSRGDLISIDGKTVRETMQEMFQKSGRTGSFADFYKQNVRQMTNELVAAGLMAGKRVEAFVPDRYGQIPKEPTQITKTGYEPSPLKPERFNAWQRYFAKRGFYKAKVARQAEYERVMAARERMRDSAQASEQVRNQEQAGMLKDALKASVSLSTAHHKDLFFGEIMGELGLRTFTTTPEGKTEVHYDWPKMTSYMRELNPGVDGSYRQFDRTEPMDTCVMGLLAQGHRFEDIMNPEKLQAERRDMARQFMEHGKTNDQDWLGRTYYQGFKASLQQLKEMTQGVDLSDGAQMARVIPKVEALAHSAFSASQMLAAKGCRLGFHMAAMEDAGGDIAAGDQRAESLNERVSDISQFSELFLDGIRGQVKLIDPQANIPRVLDTATAFGCCALSTAAIKSMQPGTSIVDWAPETEVSMFARAVIMPQMVPAGIALDDGGPEHRALVARNAASGRLTGEQLRTSVTTSDGMRKDTAFRMTKGEDGTITGQMVSIQRHSSRPEISIEVDKALTEPVNQAPQVQARQKRAPHKQPPQMNGPRR